MDATELSEAILDVVSDAQARVGPNSIGELQYDEGDEQHFEVTTLNEHLQMMEEEALDIINYGVMLVLKVRRLQSNLP